MKRSAQIFLLATIFNLINSPVFSYNDKANHLQEQARHERENKNIPKAESLYLQAVHEGDKNGYLYRTNAAEELGQWYLERKEYAKAESMFNKALSIGAREWAPSKSFDYEFENNVYLCQLYRAQKDYAKAVASLNRAVSYIGTANDMRNDDRKKLSAELIEMSRWLIENKKEKEAESFSRNALKVVNSGEDVKFHKDEIAYYRHQLAKTLIAARKYAEANALLDLVLEHRSENFKILDWEIAGPSFDKANALSGMKKDKEAKVLSATLNKYFPQSAFSTCRKQDRQSWEDTIIGASEPATRYRGHDPDEAEKALSIARKFGPKDIRYAISNARLAVLMLHKKYKQVEPLSCETVKSVKLALGDKNGATASFLEHWGKSLENRSTIHSAPFIMYKEALAIRLKTTKPGDEDAFNGAKQIGNCCKTMFVTRHEDELIHMYADAVKIIILSRGLKNEVALDALSDQIAMLEYKYRYTMNASDHTKTFSLYKELLNAQSSLYGKNSAEVKDTANQYVALLRKMKMSEEASSAAKSWNTN